VHAEGFALSFAYPEEQRDEGSSSNNTSAAHKGGRCFFKKDFRR